MSCLETHLCFGEMDISLVNIKGIQINLNLLTNDVSVPNEDVRIHTLHRH